MRFKINSILYDDNLSYKFYIFFIKNAIDYMVNEDNIDRKGIQKEKNMEY